MKKILLRIFLLALCLCMLLPTLFACGEESNPLTKNGIASVTLEKKDRIHVLLSLNSTLLNTKDKETVLLYELLPGEGVDAIAAKQPVAEKKASASMEIKLDRYIDGRDRLYSRFYAVFSDGSPVGSEAWVANPEFSARLASPSVWFGAYKGLAADDAEDAWRLGASRGLVSLDMQELLSGEDSFSFGGNSYTYSKQTLDGIKARIDALASTGMSVTLAWIQDPLPEDAVFCAFAHLLFSTAGEKINALHLTVPADCAPEKAARLMQYARLSLLSHNASGELYINLQASTLSAFSEFYTDFSKQMTSAGFSSWSCAVTPDCSVSPWEKKNDLLTVERLTEAFPLLISSGSLTSHPRKIDVTGLRFSSSDPEKQAVELAYAYRLCASLGASGIYYGAHKNGAHGLYNNDSSPRPAADTFLRLDSSLPKEFEDMCDRYTDGAYTRLTGDVGAVLLSGTSSTLGDTGEYRTLFDFTENDPLGFTAVGGSSQPICQSSAAIGAPVLFTWLMAGSTGGEGVRKIIADPQALSDAFSLSVGVLLQNGATPSSRLTLTLDGVNKKGERLRFSSTAEIKNDSWQNVVFYISTFTSAADLSKPCVLTLTAESDAPEGTEYPMWLDSPAVCSPQAPRGVGFYLLVVLACIAVSFLICVCIYLLILILRRKRENRLRRLK